MTSCISPVAAILLFLVLLGLLTRFMHKRRTVKKTEPFERAVAEIEVALKMLTPRDTANADEAGDKWLSTLYTSYLTRMLSDNGRIWSIGAIFIPLSLSAFAAYPAISAPTPFKLWVLASASSALIWCWLFIAENHRAFQEKSRAWLVAIQRHLKVDVGGVKVVEPGLNQMLTGSGIIQQMRWWLAYLVTGGWAIVLVEFSARACIAAIRSH